MSGSVPRLAVVLLCLGLVTAGCETGPGRGGAAPPRAFVGVIRVVGGPNVFLNGTPVRSGTSIYGGDGLATGPGSSAEISLAEGGLVQLNENTDPTFGFLFDPIHRSACVVIRLIASGELYGDMPCGVLEGTNGTVIRTHSIVDWTAAPGRTTITVLEGTVSLVQPVAATLQRGQQISVVNGVATPVVTLSPQQLAAVTRWRAKFTGGAQPIGPGGSAVPELVGRPLDEARRMLRDQGLAIGQVTEKFTGRAPAGTVVAQNPRARIPAAAGTVVDVLVESAEVVVTGTNVQTLMDVLNEITPGVAEVVKLLNAGNDQAAASRIATLRATFNNLERRLTSAGAGGGPLQRLYELATDSRNVQRRVIELMDAMVARRRSGDTDGYNRLVDEANGQLAQFRVNVAEIQRVLQTLR